MTIILLSCALVMLLGAKSTHAQGTVTGAIITTSVPSVTVAVNTPATFTATVTGATPNPDQYWTVIAGPTYSWWGYGANDPSTTTLSYTFSSAGTYTVTPTCVVSYIVQYARGGTATISETASAAKPVTIYVIGGPITGENDKSYFCSSNDTSGFGHLSAASGQPAGTTYSWSISGSAIFCDSNGNSTSPTGASAVYRGTNPGSTKPGDVTANVTYSLNGVSAKSDNFPITIHVPVSFAITAKTGPTKLLPPDPNAYGFNNQSITFQVLDGLGLPMKGAYWDESWSQPNGGGQPGMVGGGPLDSQGYSTDNFSISGANQPSNPNGDKIFGPLTHSYSITNTGGTGGNVGCPVHTYTNVYYYTYGLTGNGF